MPTRKMPKCEAPSGLRACLIKSGLALVEQSGAARLSLREVAKQAGVSHMAPYSHFQSKSELLCAVAAAGFVLLRGFLKKASFARTVSPATQFLDAGLAYIQFSRENPQLLALMFGGVIQPIDYSSELSDARGAAFADLTAIVERAIESGEFKKADATAVAFAGWSIAHGFSQLALGGEIQDKLGASEKALQAYARAVLAMLIDGLHAK